MTTFLGRQSGLTRFVTMSLLLTCFTPLASGGDTSSILQMFRRKPAVSPDAEVLQDFHGPWLVLAATLSGDDAKSKATSLASEIRRDLRIPAYVMKKTFDNSQAIGETTQLVDEIDGTKTQYRAWMQYANGEKEDIYAVLAGEFSSTEDPRIQETLQAIRVAQPQTLGGQASTEESDPAKADSSNWLVQKSRAFLWTKTERGVKQRKGPMGAAFVTRNPLLPDDFFEAPTVDKFVQSLNKQVEYSVLDCPGKFTVRVASFYGYASTDFGNSGGTNLGGEDPASDALDKAASKANKLTLALREKGEEAYQFHDKFGSYVMVGSFERLGDPTGQGGFVYAAGIRAVIEKYCGYRVVDVKDPQTGAISRQSSLKSEAKIPFDIDGKPMAVPRPESRSIYSGATLGRR